MTDAQRTALLALGMKERDGRWWWNGYGREPDKAVRYAIGFLRSNLKLLESKPAPVSPSEHGGGDRCEACRGTGWAGYRRTCSACRGTGQAPGKERGT